MFVEIVFCLRSLCVVYANGGRSMWFNYVLIKGVLCSGCIGVFCERKNDKLTG